MAEGEGDLKIWQMQRSAPKFDTCEGVSVSLGGSGECELIADRFEEGAKKEKAGRMSETGSNVRLLPPYSACSEHGLLD